MVEPNRLPDERAPNAFGFPSSQAPAQARNKVLGRTWTTAGRVFAIGASIFVGGILLSIGGVTRDWARLAVVLLGLGIALAAIGVQVLVDYTKSTWSPIRAVVFVVFGAPHLLLVPAVGVGLIIFAVGSLIDYPGFR